MNEHSKRMVRGALVAAGLMVTITGLVIGAGIAKSDSPAAEFVRLVRSDPDSAPLAGFSNDWLLREGVGSCNMLRAGYSHADVMWGIRTDAGLPFSSFADVALISSATVALCPDQMLVAPPSTTVA